MNHHAWLSADHRSSAASRRDRFWRVALLGLADEHRRAQKTASQPRREQGRAVYVARPAVAIGRRPKGRDAPRQWNEERRPELLRLFETHVYGKVPRPAARSGRRFQVRSRKTSRPWVEPRSAAKSRSCFPTSPTALGWISCSTCPRRPLPVAARAGVPRAQLRGKPRDSS